MVWECARLQERFEDSGDLALCFPIECTKIARISAVAAPISTAPPKNRTIV